MAEIAGWDNINVKHIWIGIEKKSSQINNCDNNLLLFLWYSIRRVKNLLTVSLVQTVIFLRIAAVNFCLFYKTWSLTVFFYTLLHLRPFTIAVTFPR